MVFDKTDASKFSGTTAITTMIPVTSRVRIDSHLIFCLPTWPTCYYSLQTSTSVKLKLKQKVGYQFLRKSNFYSMYNGVIMWHAFWFYQKQCKNDVSIHIICKTIRT